MQNNLIFQLIFLLLFFMSSYVLSFFPIPSDKNWNKLISWASVKTPSLFPFYGMIHVLVPQISAAISSNRVPQSLAFIFMEIFVYYATEQMLLIQFVYWLYNTKTAWMLSLYCAIQYIFQIHVFTEQYPNCTASKFNLMMSLSFFMIFTMLLSFCVHSPFSQHQHGSYNEFLRYNFEAYVLSEFIALLHSKIWSKHNGAEIVGIREN